MKSRRRGRTQLLVLLVLGCAAGCRSPEPVARPATPAFDPCAERLHEISGRLLLYYSLNRRLPPSLEELRTVTRDEAELTYVCPQSGETYIYRAEGLALPDGAGSLVLYDAVPVHNGGRWGIVVNRNAPGTPLTAGVVWIDETVMRSIAGGAEPLEEAGAE
ncbi:MAG: hypothetical protein AMS16_02580 [Planctomycetes bacterium DG_58]|nr:MAG: hypothetical protein AMS16_02580 [Planctomycetes bacterium DG_58]